MNSCWRAVTLHLEKHVFDSINNLYEWGTWESRVFAQCGARITQANDKHTRTWGGFEISFAEYAKEISIITLPSHRRRDRKSQITSLELPQLRALSGSVALVGCAMFDTVAGASVVVDGRNTASHSGHDLLGEQAGWEGDCVGQNATQSPCSSFSCCGYVRRCMGGPFDQTALRKGDSRSSVQTPRLLQGEETNMSLISSHPSRQRRVARSSSGSKKLKQLQTAMMKLSTYACA